MDAKYSYSWIIAEGLERNQRDIEMDGQDIPRLVELGLVREHSDGLALTTLGVELEEVVEALGYECWISWRPEEEGYSGDGDPRYGGLGKH